MSLRHRAFGELLTFTRASAATYIGSNGLLASAATGVPRIEYDPVTLAVRGLLIEPARTNYLLRSQEFDNASWSKARSSIGGTQVAAPDGTVTADNLIEDTSSAATHYATQTYTKDASTEVQVYTASVFVKAGTRTRMRLYCESTDATDSTYSSFNLGTATAGAVVQTGLWDRGQALISTYPGGWYRCSLHFRVNNDGQASLKVQFYLLDANGTSSYNGTGTDGLYLWGAQLEKGAYPTSYIATTTTSAARSADACTVTSLSPWFVEDTGTICVEYMKPHTYSSAQDTDAHYLAQVDDGTADNRHRLYNNWTRYGGTTDGGAAQALLNRGQYTALAVERAAYAWAENDIALAQSGVSGVTTDTDAVMPSDLTTFRIGSSTAADLEKAFAYIRRVRFWPRRLTDAELMATVG